MTASVCVFMILMHLPHTKSAVFKKRLMKNTIEKIMNVMEK